MAAFSKCLIDIGKISTPSNFLFVDFLNIKMENRSLDEVIAYILNLGNIVLSNSLMHILKDLDTKINNRSAQQEKAIALLSFKETIPKALVLGPYDD